MIVTAAEDFPVVASHELSLGEQSPQAHRGNAPLRQTVNEPARHRLTPPCPDLYSFAVACRRDRSSDPNRAQPSLVRFRKRPSGVGAAFRPHARPRVEPWSNRDRNPLPVHPPRSFALDASLEWWRHSWPKLEKRQCQSRSIAERGIGIDGYWVVAGTGRERCSLCVRLAESAVDRSRLQRSAARSITPRPRRRSSAGRNRLP